MQTDRIVFSSGQPYHVDLGVMIDAKIILFAEMYFGPTILGSDFIPLDDGKIYSAFFVSHVLGSLEKHISIDIAQSGKRVGIIFFLRIGES